MLLSPARAAFAEITNASGNNIKDGDNRASTTQKGGSGSGTANGGQITGVVSGGRASLDAKNKSTNSEVTSGPSRATNVSAGFTGQNTSRATTLGTTDITGTPATNVQEGDNRSNVVQAASASSGDAMAGQVIGAVTAAGGSASIVASNDTTDSDVTTGDADAVNHASGFVGQNVDIGGNLTVAADIIGFNAFNIQQGDDRATVSQNAKSSSGDGVAGQVIGVVSAGRTSIDASNHSTNVSIDSGDTTADNHSSTFAGQNELVGERITGALLSDITNVFGGNTQEGDDRLRASQSATATSGDGVGGQVIGAVTTAGGSARIVAANTSTDVSIDTGDADASNHNAGFVGQNFLAGRTVTNIVASDITTAFSGNLQEGDDRLTSNQAATATSGDGVGGQVIGVVSGGATSIDASNTSKDVDVTTGPADASNHASLISGNNELLAGRADNVITSDLNDIHAKNVQEGDDRLTSSQTATATSGDGVGGQVIGAVTSAGGTNDIAASNRTELSDVTTGDADATNSVSAIVGLNHVAGRETFGTNTVIADIGGGPPPLFSEGFNVQEGDDTGIFNQSATATSGDGVAGQVIGSVSAGRTTIDARNESKNVDVTTGDADATNAAAAIVGLSDIFGGQTVTNVITTDIDKVVSENLQEGDNRLHASQSADASSGDGVAGQVLGTVTSAGGTASLVASNSSEDVSADSGDATATNDFAGLVGEQFVFSPGSVTNVIGADISNSIAFNVQEGDNRATQSQAASAVSGDAVTGQVFGVVTSAGGNVSVVIDNQSKDVDSTTGDFNFLNDNAIFVGLNAGNGKLVL